MIVIVDVTVKVTLPELINHGRNKEYAQKEFHRIGKVYKLYKQVLIQKQKYIKIIEIKVDTPQKDC